MEATVREEYEREKSKRMYEDRKALLRKITHIGYVPDYDLRKQLFDIRVELYKRIDYQREELFGK